MTVSKNCPIKSTPPPKFNYLFSCTDRNRLLHTTALSPSLKFSVPSTSPTLIWFFSSSLALFIYSQVAPSPTLISNLQDSM